MRTLEITIDDVAFGGNGIGRDAGKAVFVPFTIDGERIAARITREKKKFAEAELVGVLDPSAERTQPQCPYFGRCGGCAYQHISYDHQLHLKARQVEQAMRRIGKMSEPPMRPMVPSPASYNYRNRITVHVDNDVIGFYRRDVHQLMDIKQCPISMPEVNKALADLRATRPRDGHYSLRTHSGPRVFAQTNDAVADAMAQFIATVLPANGKLLIDAFCGAGFFAKRLAARFERVIGIDWDRFAIQAAQKDAGPNETYIAGDVALELERASRSGGLSRGRGTDEDMGRFGKLPSLGPFCIIVDPPATGLTPEMRQAVINASPQNIIYVSCNPPTLARDLGELQSRFSVISITPFDMFPQTAEIEVVAILEASGDPARE